MDRYDGDIIWNAQASITYRDKGAYRSEGIGDEDRGRR
jgi:hypothetical protein